jgi:(1->4)-alpha-D-glucan 1-alpha-D-glucosylmutase
VPDIYQGTELWDFSLVDPDNRRPVDFTLRRQCLETIADASPRELLEHWRDGRIKMFIIQRLLALRREQPALFASGSYTGLHAHGSFADHVISFERRHKDAAILVIAPRHTAQLGFPPIGEAWKDTHLALPRVARWCDVFTDREHPGDKLALSNLFADLPFSVLVEVVSSH